MLVLPSALSFKFKSSLGLLLLLAEPLCLSFHCLVYFGVWGWTGYLRLTEDSLLQLLGLWPCSLFLDVPRHRKLTTSHGQFPFWMSLHVTGSELGGILNPSSSNFLPPSWLLTGLGHPCLSPKRHSNYLFPWPPFASFSIPLAFLTIALTLLAGPAQLGPLPGSHC